MCRNNDVYSGAIKNSECSTEKKCDYIENYCALNIFDCAPSLALAMWSR